MVGYEIEKKFFACQFSHFNNYDCHIDSTPS